ncbi:MAG: SusF/SusE family outer membrane protein [Duncaniella sp.]|nr:SusF/SusE family outer membrane protein [Duncaniella sp.]MDE6466208.1 SusF/SusE family outer membrane protein [Duncaniella sp.]
MKKLALFSIFALGLAAVSCEDFDYPNPPAQSNEQLPVLDASGVTVSAVNAGQTVDLAQLSEAGSLISLGKLDASGDFDATVYEFTYTAEMAVAEDFAGAKTVNCVTENGVAKVSPDEVEGLFHDFFNTIDPSARDAWFRLKLYAQNKDTGMKYRVGGEKTFYASQSLSLVPFDPGFTVEEKYYLIGTVTGEQISSQGAILLSNGGGSPYDNPEFSALITVDAAQAQAGYNWAIVPESTMAAGSGVVMAPTAEFVGESTIGTLSSQDALGNWNTIYKEGTYVIKVNVRPNDAGEFVFSYIPALDNLWINGDGNNWDFANSTMLYTSDYSTYLGYAHLKGGFKIVKADNWNNGDYGGKDGELTNGGENIPVEGDGLFWIEANVVEMTYALSHIATYGIIGNATPSGWDGSTAMTPDETFLKWTVSVALTEGSMKFRANDAWDIDLGGLGEGSTPQEPVLELKSKGSDIVISEAGNYDITLDLSKLPYTCTFIKK